MPKSLIEFCELTYLKIRTIGTPLEYLNLIDEVFSLYVIPSPSSLCPNPISFSINMNLKSSFPYLAYHYFLLH